MEDSPEAISPRSIGGRDGVSEMPRALGHLPLPVPFREEILNIPSQ